MITFGTISGDEDVFDGYVILSDGSLLRETSLNSDEIVEETGIKLSEADYCDFRKDLLNLYNETQATNQPGVTTHYIEYMVPDRNLRLKARWNPAFDNVGNEKWKKLWARLELLMAGSQ
jgi:hypothetical protein